VTRRGTACELVTNMNVPFRTWDLTCEDSTPDIVVNIYCVAIYLLSVRYDFPKNDSHPEPNHGWIQDTTNFPFRQPSIQGNEAEIP
jgi:hypothetical protein